ncbi:hypothetical protein ACFW96_27510 [Streptomyces gardneri]|uniref:hypothetical protein n=1 Tax=Streptomyces gardneri TaxID=66892 RepID=UPI00367CB281
MLHFAVQWVDQHPLTWLNGAFPSSYEVDGWALNLSETRLDAKPPMPMTEDEARSGMTPILDTWTAVLEIEQRLVVTFYYLGASLEPDATEGGTAADFATVSATAFDAAVTIQRGTPREPDWSWRDTEATQLARTMCLRPLRNGSRPVADAAYWLATHLKQWADTESAAAARLNVSTAYVKRVRLLGARSHERKVMPNSLELTAQDKEFLNNALEELVRRLHLVESGLPPGERLDLTDGRDP